MTQDITREQERIAFDKAVDAYDRVRPSYPPALFDELFRYLRERIETSAPAVLEIGAGTGKATVDLLARGACVTAVEIGPEMSAFLERKFAGDGRFSVINASFEEAELRQGTYDAVASFTAFHWVDPEMRYLKSHDILRPGGVLAVVMTNQIESAADRGFFDRVQPIYQKYFPGEERTPLPGDEVVPLEHGEMITSGLFEDVQLHRYRWDQTYVTADYADLMRSYANSQVMEPAAREALIAEMCEVIDAEYGGSVTRPLVMTLTMGRKPTSQPRVGS